MWCFWRIINNWKKAEFIKEILDDFFEIIVEKDEKFNLEDINIVSIVQDEILSFYDEIKKLDIDMQISIEDEVLMVLWEKISIEKVVQNLLVNAIRYGEKYIEVTMFKEDDKVKLIISNNCSKINCEDIDKIFNRCYILNKNGNSQGNEKVLSSIGALVKGSAFYEYLSAEENFKIFAAYSNVYYDNKIKSIFELVGWKDREKYLVSNYSLGMKERLGISQSLLNDQEILILDEPTNGLDLAGIKEIRELIIRLSKERKNRVL